MVTHEEKFHNLISTGISGVE